MAVAFLCVWTCCVELTACQQAACGGLAPVRVVSTVPTGNYKSLSPGWSLLEHLNVERLKQRYLLMAVGAVSVLAVPFLFVWTCCFELTACQQAACGGLAPDRVVLTVPTGNYKSLSSGWSLLEHLAMSLFDDVLCEMMTCVKRMYTCLSVVLFCFVLYCQILSDRS
eukprot:TRINITY_DN12499_c2_g1_i17.p1 TRINITY_DN12499_c2_g1~~TRINITY_DN12499_c2_g1_i17.p1  ORF type:complete len:189 (+),score=11.26 TRINITY_DN12499_c2_g1_i17:68-568(+)